MTELAFVLARGQNAFFGELVEVLRDELDQLGVASSVALDGLPEPQRGLVPILLPPHEYFALRGDAEPADSGILRRTVFVCAEQPASQWFRDNVDLARNAGAVLDINTWGVREWRRHGVPAEHLPVGWTRRWDRSPFDRPRAVDMAFLGSHSGRRAKLLAGQAPSLWRWRTHLLLSDNGKTNPADGPDFVTGEQKRDLLARTRVLLNIHGSDLPYFESLRVVESILCGAVVVSEHSTLTTPFEPGRDYVSAAPENLVLLAEELLEDEPRRAAFAQAALGRLRAELPLRSSAERLAAMAEALDRSAPLGPAGAAILRATAPELESEATEKEDVPLPPTEDVFALRRTLKRARLELISERRRRARLELELAGKEPLGVDVAGVTPAYTDASPRVSVVVTLYDYEAYIDAALESIAASGYRSFEVIVVDDASTDGSLECALAWAGRHPTLAATILRQHTNRGLPHARNAGLAAARGELIFVLDADNAIYPHCLGRLVEALDEQTDAVFAYGLAERFGPEGPEGLLSVGGWDPHRLRDVNYIDAMAMIRADALRELEGYTDDVRLHGWEDYDLWCKVAERGWHGHAVREILARYRVTDGSMLASVTTLSATDAYVALAERHPTLMAGVAPPR